MSDDNKNEGKESKDDNKGEGKASDAKDDNKSKAADGKETKNDEKENLKADANKKNSNKEDGFTPEYIKELREEAKEHRLKAKETEAKLLEAQKQIDELGKQSIEKVNKLHTQFEKRIINAELTAIAAEEGLIDKDAFKMVDLSQVKLNDDGEVIGLKEVVADLRKNKPYLFDVKSTSKKDAKTPDSDGTDKERPTYKDASEFNKAKQAFINKIRVGQ